LELESLRINETFSRRQQWRN